MLTLPGIQQFVGNNPLAVGTSGSPVRIFSVEVVASGDGATVVELYNSTTTTSNTNYARINAATSKCTTVTYFMGKRFPNGCYLSTDANTAFATVVYEQEM